MISDDSYFSMLVSEKDVQHKCKRQWDICAYEFIIPLKRFDSNTKSICSINKTLINSSRSIDLQTAVSFYQVRRPFRRVPVLNYNITI